MVCRGWCCPWSTPEGGHWRQFLLERRTALASKAAGLPTRVPGAMGVLVEWVSTRSSRTGRGDIDGGRVILQVKTVVSSGLDWRAGYPRSGIRWFLGACDRGHSGALALCLHGCRDLVRVLVPWPMLGACGARRIRAARRVLTWKRLPVALGCRDLVVTFEDTSLCSAFPARWAEIQVLVALSEGPCLATLWGARRRTKGSVGLEAESAGGGGLTDGVGSI